MRSFRYFFVVVERKQEARDMFFQQATQFTAKLLFQSTQIGPNTPFEQTS